MQAPSGCLKGSLHNWQQALLADPTACRTCRTCRLGVQACPERAITLARLPSGGTAPAP
ncbi:hypothetical protein OOT46_19815 [Aquabacterium sp. A7-Y]|uniref:hypothetical protein n=1 Tax=Aquabacterium sp. A7-Y TaxID=1349605 RepID=UPI00223E3252|nr:hypothetical protein [Aquabacterium sp. A7-Y]MCW7540086.1 hypothetical protein [Aquabacterium sp. A7-Y]